MRHDTIKILPWSECSFSQTSDPPSAFAAHRRSSFAQLSQLQADELLSSLGFTTPSGHPEQAVEVQTRVDGLPAMRVVLRQPFRKERELIPTEFNYCALCLDPP